MKILCKGYKTCPGNIFCEHGKPHIKNSKCNCIYGNNCKCENSNFKTFERKIKLNKIKKDITEEKL